MDKVNINDEEQFFQELGRNIGKNNDLKTYSALSLAYLGDAVFELFVRTLVLENGDSQVNKLHKKSRSYVNATSQSEMYFKVIDILSEDELVILKRGRNAKSFTTAKNASIKDYRHATGLEALFGYLYIQGKTERLFQIFEKCVE